MLIFNLFIAASNAYAWKLPVEVAVTPDGGEKFYNKLVIGIESGATDAFDNLWDTPAMLSRPDLDNPLHIRAYLNEDGSNPDDTRYLWKDIRGAAVQQKDVIWDITVDSVPLGNSVVVSWQFPAGLLKKGERLVLRDNDAVDSGGAPIEVDTTQSGSYTFESTGDAPKSLSLVLSSEPVKKSSNGGGSGFGCGTIRPHRGDHFPGSGSVAINMIILFSPILFLRLLRLTPLR